MAVFVPEMVAQAWVRSELIGSASVLSALGSSAIYPNNAPPEVTGRHISHWFYGPSGGESAFPIGRGLVQICMTWRISGWEPSTSQQALAPLMKAVMSTLIGPIGRGRIARFTYDGDAFTMECRFIGPDIAKVEPPPGPAWAPIHHLYDLTVRAEA